MRYYEHNSFSAALADVTFLVGLAPTSISPITVAELHLYAYLGNLTALKAGSPISDWGYRFSITESGFPFSYSLDEARNNLITRSVIWNEPKGLVPNEERYELELALFNQLSQSARRKVWLKTALDCVLNLPSGSIRYAINKTPGVSVNLRDRRTSMLLKDSDIENIYDEFKIIDEILDKNEQNVLQPMILWLSARIFNEG